MTAVSLPVTSDARRACAGTNPPSDECDRAWL